MKPILCNKRHLDSQWLWDVIPGWSLKQFKDRLYFADAGQTGAWDRIIRDLEMLDYKPVASVMCALAAECVGGFRDVSGMPTRIPYMDVHKQLDNQSCRARLCVILEDNDEEGMQEFVSECRPRWLAMAWAAIPDEQWRDSISAKLRRTGSPNKPTSTADDDVPADGPYSPIKGGGTPAPATTRKPGQPPSYSPPPASSPAPAASPKPSAGKRVKSFLGLGDK